MKEKVDGKQNIFSTYFVINNGVLFETDNFNFDDNLTDCFHIKKFGFIHPVICIDTKADNKWINKNQIISDYNTLMDFIVANKNSYICIRGFSYTYIEFFIKMINELKETNIKFIKFKTKVSKIQYERHIFSKEQRINDLKQKLATTDENLSSKQYMKIANGVFNEEKHKSIAKIIRLKK
ncbi:MAG: hypothetical protein MR266_04935 [Erysipelotrichaceae bacterium]|nr:hypothetical protein [Erysipelotrichaceae bacterium]